MRVKMVVCILSKLAFSECKLDTIGSHFPIGVSLCEALHKRKQTFAVERKMKTFQSLTESFNRAFPNSPKKFTIG